VNVFNNFSAKSYAFLLNFIAIIYIKNLKYVNLD
jgi:hypothetical protein